MLMIRKEKEELRNKYRWWIKTTRNRHACSEIHLKMPAVGNSPNAYSRQGNLLIFALLSASCPGQSKVSIVNSALSFLGTPCDSTCTVHAIRRPRRRLYDLPYSLMASIRKPWACMYSTWAIGAAVQIWSNTAFPHISPNSLRYLLGPNSRIL